MTIESHQDLLDKYAVAARSVISERSSDMSRDLSQLYVDIEEYAEKNDLKCPPVSDFTWASMF